MNKFLFFLSFFLLSHVFGQETINELKSDLPPLQSDTNVVYDFVDVPAEFPGGMSRLRGYLAENIVYPKDAIQRGVEGKCYVTLVITKTGEVKYVKVKRGVPDCPECDAEAVRVVQAMPLWKPATINGKNVNCLYNLPIIFALMKGK